MRASIRRVGAADPELAAHLDVAVRTGAVGVDAPDPRSRVAWRLTPA